jgi:hypothetical protein
MYLNAMSYQVVSTEFLCHNPFSPYTYLPQFIARS